MPEEKKTYWQFIRTCQECGHKQTDTEPEFGKVTDKWLEKKCKKCKSEALDYGSNQEFDDKGNPVIYNEDE
jgi:hypothetical protein